MKTKKQLKEEIAQLSAQVAEVTAKLDETSSEEYKTNLLKESEELKKLEKEREELSELLKEANEKIELVNKNILGGGSTETPEINEEELEKIKANLKAKLKGGH